MGYAQDIIVKALFNKRHKSHSMSHYYVNLRIIRMYRFCDWGRYYKSRLERRSLFIRTKIQPVYKDMEK